MIIGICGIKRFTGSASNIVIEDMREHLKLWERRSHKMHYSHIVNKPLECIEYIAEVLGFDVDCKAILKEFEAIEPPKEGYDPVTFLFHNHISDNEL